jgi:hypothetical protein
MAKNAISRVAILILPLVAIACREELKNSDQVAPIGPIWTGNTDCDGCLQSLCADSNGQSAYTGCQEQASCKLAMTKFTSCYSSQPGLSNCSSEMTGLRSSSDAGSQLLDCFLLRCFFTVCETVRKVD